ncbi:DNA polymerase delta subunit 2 [Phlyctochytrium planicorne]|nr:DNA polymerase delta subunit 2 [Phlyctochytrium planicorne]
MVVERKTVAFSNENDVFILKERSYTQQFAGIYFTRLNMLRPAAMEECSKRWSNDVQKGQRCCFVGTLYKEMPLKPNILEELSEESLGSLPQPPRQSYWGDSDEFLMEDESGRIKLVGDIMSREVLVTGSIFLVTRKV